VAEIQTYPTGTPGSADVLPYVEDPGGTPALKLVSRAALAAAIVPTVPDPVWYASSGDPNSDVTVPSPPPNTRALCFDRASAGLDVWKWDTPPGGTYTDTFDGTLSDPAPNGAPYTSTPSGTWTISGGVIHADGASGSLRYRTADWADADPDVSVTLDGNGDNLGIVLRYVDANNWVRFVADTSNTYLTAYIGGSHNSWASYSGGGGAGVVLRAVAVGNVYTLYRAGSLLGTYTDTGNHFLTATTHGLISLGTTVGFRDLTVVTAGGGSPVWLNVAPLV
jgi:hypothetical protein